MVVCIYKRTTDLLNKILKNHLPLERNTWNDCSSCDIGNVFWHLPIRTWQNSRITIDFCLLSFLIAAVFVSCCASSLSKHLYLDRKNHLRLYQWTLWTVSSGSWFFSFWNQKILLLSGVCYSWWILVFRGSCRKLIMSNVHELDIADTENFYQKLPLQMFVVICSLNLSGTTISSENFFYFQRPQNISGFCRSKDARISPRTRSSAQKTPWKAWKV